MSLLTPIGLNTHCEGVQQTPEVNKTNTPVKTVVQRVLTENMPKDLPLSYETENMSTSPHSYEREMTQEEALQQSQERLQSQGKASRLEKTSRLAKIRNCVAGVFKVIGDFFKSIFNYICSCCTTTQKEPLETHVYTPEERISQEVENDVQLTLAEQEQRGDLIVRPQRQDAPYKTSTLSLLSGEDYLQAFNVIPQLNRMEDLVVLE